MDPLDTFETRLLAELRTVVDQGRPVAPPTVVPSADAAPTAARRPRRTVWAVGVAAAAVTAGAVLVVPTVLADPAWAVTGTATGEVDITVDRIEDAAGLERALAATGITADVTFVPDGGQCAEGRYTELDATGTTLSIGSDHSFRITLPDGTVPADGTLVIAASWLAEPDSTTTDGTTTTDGFRVWVDVGVTTGPVGACAVVAG
ncbi:MAG TPA: hypothetical protein VGC67_00600 [Cellulomonas sp.]